MPFLNVTLRRLGWTLAALASTSAVAVAADLTDRSSDTPALRGPIGVMERPSRGYDPSGLRFGNWLFMPQVLSSVTFDDNLFATRFNKKSDFVTHFIPSLTASGDFGKTKVSAYASVDGRIYSKFSELNSVAPAVGIGFKSEIQRDLIVQGRADYAYRVEDPGDTRNLSGAPGALGTQVRYHDTSVSGSINKSFGPYFVSAGAIFQNLVYKDGRDILGNTIPQSFRNANITTATLRGGYEFGPGLRAFIEPSVNWRDFYNFGAFNSTGYKVVGGLSSELTRLVRGEVYAGYMEQDYHRNFGRISSYTFGGKVMWYPTNLLTVTANADRSIAESGITTVGGFGSPVISTSAGVRADYEMLRNLIISGRVIYRHYAYTRAPRVDDLTTGGLTATYKINRMFTTSLDYNYTDGQSNVNAAKFKRNQITLSLKSAW